MFLTPAEKNGVFKAFILYCAEQYGIQQIDRSVIAFPSFTSAFLFDVCHIIISASNIGYKEMKDAFYTRTLIRCWSAEMYCYIRKIFICQKKLLLRTGWTRHQMFYYIKKKKKRFPHFCSSPYILLYDLDLLLYFYSPIHIKTRWQIGRSSFFSLSLYFFGRKIAFLLWLNSYYYGPLFVL